MTHCCNRVNESASQEGFEIFEGSGDRTSQIDLLLGNNIFTSFLLL